MTWSNLASILQGDVQQEIIADAPQAIHREAIAIGVTPAIPPPPFAFGFWTRYRFIILTVLGIGIVWYFFFRK